MLMNSSEYVEVLCQVKQHIAKTRSRAASKANSELICMYWRIGALLNENDDWGSGFLESLSKDIRNSYPGIKGFSVRYLKYMKKFARECDAEKVHTVYALLSWSHIRALMDKVKNLDERLWYAQASVHNGWPLATLGHQMDLHAYERQAKKGKISNFSKTLPDPQSELMQQALKDPYVFDFITAEQGREERDIEQAMMDNLQSLLLELGTGFALVGRQYHLVVGEDDFYIDMLFYNIRLHCYVVVELKNQDFKPEFNGQLGFYVAAVDGELRDEADNHTIGLLLCKTKNNAVAEYSLRSMNAPIGISEYRLGDDLPEEYAKILPSAEDIMARI